MKEKNTSDVVVYIWCLYDIVSIYMLQIPVLCVVFFIKSPGLVAFSTNAKAAGK